MASSTPHQTSVDMNALSSFITAIHGRNDAMGISSFTWGGGTSSSSDCLPICIKMQSPPPAKSSSQSLGKIIFGLTFQAVLALFIFINSSPSSPPSLPTLLFGGSVLISFAVSFAGLFLQTGYPRAALLFEKVSALFAAVGVCIVAGVLLVHQNFAWICWLACAFTFIVFLLSFK